MEWHGISRHAVEWHGNSRRGVVRTGVEWRGQAWIGRLIPFNASFTWRQEQLLLRISLVGAGECVEGPEEWGGLRLAALYQMCRI